MAKIGATKGGDGLQASAFGDFGLKFGFFQKIPRNRRFCAKNGLKIEKLRPKSGKIVKNGPKIGKIAKNDHK